MKFDIQVLANYGIEVRGPLFDTMIAHYLLEPDMRHNMNLLSETYLSYSPVHIESLIGEKGNQSEKYAYRFLLISLRNMLLKMQMLLFS